MTEIQEYKLQLKKIEAAKIQVVEVKKRLMKYKEEIKKAEERLHMEQHDVEKLRQLSLSSLYSFFKKNKEERLKKEEKEALQAAVYVKQMQADEEILRKEYRELCILIDREISIEKHLHKLQHQSFQNHAVKDEEMEKLLEDMENNRIFDKELKDAYESGDSVYHKLSAAIHDLENAEGWGMYDIIAGGFISSVIKHERIDDAQQRIADIQLDVYRFQKEAQDVMALQLSNIDAGKNLPVFDIAFDNLIADFMVQSRIRQSLLHVQEFKENVKNILSDLHKKEVENQKQYDDMEERYHRMLDQGSVDKVNSTLSK